MHTHVFAYGSNLDTDRMTGRVPSATVVGRASLVGFELRFHKQGWKDGTGKADAFAVDHPEAVVHGIVYRVDVSELDALDVHETGYERRLVELSIGTREGVTELEAWVYMAVPDVIDGTLVPTGWYLDHVVRGAREHGLPPELIAWLKAHPTEG
ncbi:MAG: gamma-glutamylcyclotransferase [Gemmatimonadota bacterium]